MMTHKIVSDFRVYNGYLKVDSINIEENGQQYQRELIRRGHSVCVFIFDSRLKKVLFTEQLRVGCCPEPRQLIECVAGMIDDNESAQEAAIRETREETGLFIASSKLIEAGTYLLSPGILSEQTSIFLVDTDLRSVDTDKRHGETAENESITLHLLSYEETEILFSPDSDSHPIVPVLARNIWLAHIKSQKQLPNTSQKNNSAY